jgi:hypothetical protein
MIEEEIINQHLPYHRYAGCNHLHHQRHQTYNYTDRKEKLPIKTTHQPLFLPNFYQLHLLCSRRR